MLSKQPDEVDRRILLETTRLLRLWQAEIKRHERESKRLREAVWRVQDACPHRRKVGTECQICGKDLAEQRGT